MSALPPPPVDDAVTEKNGKPTPPWNRWLLQLWEAVRPLQTTFVWDPGSLADGAGETSSAVTLNGSALGDSVLVGAPYDLQGVVCTGYVSALNTVRVRLQNETGGDVDLASGTWRVRVLKNG